MIDHNESKDAETHFQLGREYAKKQNWPAAEQSFRKAIAGSVGNPQWFVQLGMTLLRQRRRDEALGAFSAALPLYEAESRRGNTQVLTEWSKTLSWCERYHDAFQIALKAVRSLGPQPPIERRLWDASMTLVSVDHLSVLEGWRSLRGAKDLDGFFLRHYLNLCKVCYLLEDDAYAAARHAVAPGSDDPEAKRRGFEFLALADGPSLPLAKGLITLWDEGSAAGADLAREIASMLFEIGECGELIQFYERNQMLLEGYLGETPALAYAYLRSNSADKAYQGHRLAEETFASYVVVQQAGKDICSRIADPSRTLAIVGNSPCELGLRRGVEIDRHDTVIRFNNFSVAPPYDQDYGKKVDIIVSGQALYKDNDQKEARGADLLSEKNPILDWWAVRRSFARGRRFAPIPMESRRELSRLLKISPSSGLLVCWVAAKLRGPGNPFSAYGFSFIDQIGPNRTSAHYFDQSGPYSIHDWPAEARLFKKIMGRAITT